jgi:hypothetical protein
LNEGSCDAGLHQVSEAEINSVVAERYFRFPKSGVRSATDTMSPKPSRNLSGGNMNKPSRFRRCV